MLLRSSRPPTTTTIILFAIFSVFQFIFASASSPSHEPHPPLDQGDSRKTSELTCRPFGICEPCPKEELEQPFCQPFGNRRLMHCVTQPNSRAIAEAVPGPPHHGWPHHASNAHPPPFEHTPDHAGETPAWESCGRIVAQEYADFWEFVACNIVFAIVALTLLVVRSRRMQALHARQLAARIGIARGSARLRG